MVPTVTSGPMDFTPSDRVLQLRERIAGFLDEHYYPTSHGNNNILPGAPRSVRIGINTGL